MNKILFLTLIALSLPSQTWAKEKKKFFQLTDAALGNSKTFTVINREGVLVKAKAINKSSGSHHDHKVEVDVSIDCDGKGEEWSERTVSIEHNSYSHIENKQGNKLVLCALYNLDADPMNVHLIVYERDVNGQCKKDSRGDILSEDIVIPIHAVDSEGKPLGFCDK